MVAGKELMTRLTHEEGVEKAGGELAAWLVEAGCGVGERGQIVLHCIELTEDVGMKGRIGRRDEAYRITRRAAACRMTRPSARGSDRGKAERAG